jgi:hypothetical protein
MMRHRTDRESGEGGVPIFACLGLLGALLIVCGTVIITAYLIAVAT